MAPSYPPEENVWLNMAQSSAAACIAETVTLPLDTAKVRLQLQNIAGAQPGVVHKYKGPFGTLSTIIREEGLAAPYKGLAPGLHRAVIFTGLRLGLYEHTRNLFEDSNGEISFGGRVAAALLTSALGITVAQPTDVIKVRLQAASQRRAPTGQLPAAAALAEPSAPPGLLRAAPAYRGTLDAYRRTLAEEGFIGGLYRGYLPNLLRNSVISATELVVYDTSKQAFLQAGLQDGVSTHFMSGISAGFAATVLGSPWDVIGTRLMAVSQGPSDAPRKIRARTQSLPAFCWDMLRTEGIGSFWKGFVPNFARIGSFNIVLWLSYEEIRHASEHLA